MKAEELIHKMNSEYGIKPWPKTLEVDPETYANCCQYVFNNKVQELIDLLGKDVVKNEKQYLNWIEVTLGPSNNGLILKNVELILKPTSLVP